MTFSIEYEDLKKILNVFYHIQYQQALPFVDILHNVKETESGITLKEKIDIETALAVQEKPQEE